MAGSSLLTLIDDIASLLDDVSLMTKMAAKKTAGVLGDDLALNAQQVSGVKADRELPVVWSVAKGSFINKAILVPLALLISAFAPWAITPLLMVGGAYLCYEGFEKVFHSLTHSKQTGDEEKKEALDANEDVAAYEQRKVKGAIRTDFVLSAEIIAITLGTVAGATFSQQVIVLCGIAIVMTAGVYGIVAGIVKLDDLGLYLSRKSSALVRSIGNGIVSAAPYLMRTLSIVGTIAMFMVGGGILTHGLPPVHHLFEDWASYATVVPTFGHILQGVIPALLNVVFGLIAGGVVLLVVSALGAIRGRLKA
ncbi:Inner membrane protein yedI [Serratia quinivorans]|nr:Inner membrane protein yedI [Serratia quinivorans]